MKFIFHIFIFLLFSSVNIAFSQKMFYTHEGFISFYSKAPLEDIEAKNNNVSSVINVETGEIKFKVMIHLFQFPNSTMQEHFNENYMETEKYPTAEFSGRIMDFANVDLKKDGTFNVTITGDLTIHGKTRKVTHKGTITRSGNNITADSKFRIKVADYDIKIPTLVIKNIAEEVDVTVKMNYKPTMK
jgi:hypothetical protein